MNFQGTTKLKLTKADMMQAIQYWLNKEILKNPVVVKDVDMTSINRDKTFEIQLEGGNGEDNQEMQGSDS